MRVTAREFCFSVIILLTFVDQVPVVQRGRVVGDCISHCFAAVADDQTVRDGLQAVLCRQEENAREN